MLVLRIALKHLTTTSRRSGLLPSSSRAVVSAGPEGGQRWVHVVNATVEVGTILEQALVVLSIEEAQQEEVLVGTVDEGLDLRGEGNNIGVVAALHGDAHLNEVAGDDNLALLHFEILLLRGKKELGASEGHRKS